jgi:Domain of unknown function (DUF4388)
MSDIQNAHGILHIIQSINSNRESGQLEIRSFGSRGTLLFNKGKLVDATLGSLTGFQAVNAAVSLRNVQFSFDPLTAPPGSGSIARNERIVLKRFFGIETAEMDGTDDGVEPPIDWNATPHRVVPLAEGDEVDQNDLQDTPTVEVKPVVSSVLEEPLTETAFVGNETAGQSSVHAEQQFVAAETTPERQTRRKARPQNIINAEGFRFPLRLHVAVSLMLLLVLAAAAIALIPKLKARRELASMAPRAAEQSLAVPESTTPDVKKKSLPDSGHKVEQVVSKSQSTAVAQQQSPRVRSGGPSSAVAAGQGDESAQRDPNVQDLTGEWKVINTVEQTGYKSFENMQIGFRLIIEQTGKDFTARGEKVSENGRNLPASNRTPIRVTGSVDGDKVVATFIEDGRMRRTNGRFTWRLQNENAALTGTFVSAAANSSGKSAATRQP